MLSSRIMSLATIALSLLILFDPKVSAAKDTNKLASEFCSQRRTQNDRRFCLKILTSDPKNDSAKDYSALLKIAITAAEGNAKRALEYFNAEFKSKATNPNLKPVLKESIRIYGIVLNEFKGILDNLGVKNALVKLYARVANDEIRACDSFVTSKKIAGKSITNRNKIAEKFGVLVEDIAQLV